MRLKKELNLAAALLLASVPLVGHTEDGLTHQVGLASYGSTVSYDSYIGEDSFSGAGVFYTGAMSNSLAFRVGLFSTDYDGDYSFLNDVSASGHEISVLLGGNLQGVGAKAYLGLGVFSEEWEANNGATIDFSGSQLTLGVGYNAERVAFDLWVSVRDSSDYEDSAGSTATATASGLMVSARF